MNRSGYVAVVGGINMDIQARSLGPFMAGDSNPGTTHMSAGGVGRNIAENLVRLGLCAELVTVFGTDPFSTDLYESCMRRDIGLRGALRLSEPAISQYICLLNENGSLVGAISAMDSIEELTPMRLTERSGLLDGASLIVIDANVPVATIAWLVERYGPEGTGIGFGHERPHLVLDPVSVAKAAKVKDFIGSFSFAKPNRAEAEILSGVAITSRDDLVAAAESLGRKGLREVFISMGAEGLYYDNSGSGDDLERGFVRPPKLPVVNVSGGGDAACAALAWGYLSDYSIKERAALAVAAATLAASSEETVSPEMNASRILELAEGAIHE